MSNQLGAYRRGVAGASPGKILVKFNSLRAARLHTQPRPTQWAKQKGQLSKLLMHFEESEVIDRMSAYFEDDDEYLQKNAYTLGLFLARFDSYSKQIVSLARAQAEARKKRETLDESPGSSREAHSTEARLISEILKDLKL